MRVSSFISQKCGVGKTTLAIHLATAFVAGGYNTALLNLDPQASAGEGKDVRKDEKPAGPRRHCCRGVESNVLRF